MRLPTGSAHEAAFSIACNGIDTLIYCLYIWDVHRAVAKQGVVVPIARQEAVTARWANTPTKTL